jgi:hypothetical protein
MQSWQHAATTDPGIVHKWWNGLYREHGVGIAMGRQPDGRWIFTLDVDEHDPAVSGSDTLAELEHRHGRLPDTVRSITGSGGAHHIFDAGTVEVTNGAAGQVGPGIDIRGAGGQIVVAPTIHPCGTAYQWEAGCAPWEAEIARAPAWLLELVKPPPIKVDAPTLNSAPPNSSILDSPADVLRARWDWYTELTKRGWQPSRRTNADGSTQWTRPGKDPREGTSAVLHGPDGPLVVFTTDASVAPMWRAGKVTADGSGVSLSPLAYLAAYDHGGDLSAATRALRATMGPSTDLGALIAPSGQETADPGTVDPSVDPDADLRALLIDWPAFWQVDHNATDWLAEPIIATGRSHALFAPGGTGKSLLALWLAAAIATGRPIFGHTAEARDVLYLDYEMTEDDLAERLEAMGYDAGHDLDRLHYALLPSLPGLDEPEGGKAVVRLAELCDAQLVIIDTFGRAVHGDENEADTVRAWYRWTGLHLKAAGRAFMRVDHAGKDLDKGQRGTSAKNDDVDVVWQMTRQDGDTFRLTAKKRRMGWVPDKVDLTRREDHALEYALTAGDTYPDGTKAVAEALAELGVPVDATTRVAEKALRSAGRGARNELIRAAVRWRKAELPPFVDGPETVGAQGGAHVPAEPVGAASGRTNDETVNPQVDADGRKVGRTGAQPRRTYGAQPVLISTGAPSAPPVEPTPEPIPDREPLM